MLRHTVSRQESFIASSSFPHHRDMLPQDHQPQSFSLAGLHHPPHSLPHPTPFPLLLEELLVEEENEQVDIDLGFIEHLHDGYTLVLQLQQVLQER